MCLCWEINNWNGQCADHVNAHIYVGTAWQRKGRDAHIYVGAAQRGLKFISIHFQCLNLKFNLSLFIKYFAYIWINVYVLIFFQYTNKRIKNSNHCWRNKNVTCGSLDSKIFTLLAFSATINIRKILTFNFPWSVMRRCNNE